MRSIRLLFYCLAVCCLRVANAQPQPAATIAGSGWKRLELADNASVEIPEDVHTTPSSTAKMPVYLAKSQGIIFIVVANQVDSAKSSHSDGELNDYELNRVYEATVKSLIGTDSGARVVSRKNFELAGRRGLEVKIAALHTPGLATTKFARVLFAHRVVYLLTWRETAAHAAADAPRSRARFFNSLHVKVLPAPFIPKSYQKLGWLLVVVALLAGLFFFVRRVFAQSSKLPLAP